MPLERWGRQGDEGASEKAPGPRHPSPKIRCRLPVTKQVRGHALGHTDNVLDMPCHHWGVHAWFSAEPDRSASLDNRRWLNLNHEF